MSDLRNIQISLPSTGEEEWQALKDPLLSGWLTQGPKVAAFERRFAEIHGVKYAYAVTSCTTALHLALLGVGVGPGDEVIVPAFTWVATANAVIYCGATPVFADVSRESFNLDIESVRKHLTPRTKAVLPVHLFGKCAEIDGLRAAIPSGVKIIEDAACASGAIYRGRFAGSLGDVAAFSFHPRKSITTGEGGMVTTNDPDIARIVDQLRNHGAAISEEQRHLGPRPYLLPEFDLLGYNYRMTDLQGAVGLVSFVKERSKWAAWYRENLGDIDWLELPDEPLDGRHAWQAYVTYVKPEKAPYPRNEIMEKLQKQGIATRPGTHAVHMLGYYRKSFGCQPGDYSGARDCNDHTMAIPLHNRMSPEDYQYVVSALHRIV
jgi:perosamine synthetase